MKTDKNNAMRIHLLPNETVVKASESKHHKGKDAVMGKLILTNQRILFTDSENAQILLSIFPNCIQEVLPYHTGIFTSKGLEVVLKDVNTVRFTMGNVSDWTRLINKMY
jgi:hypothetical protein